MLNSTDEAAELIRKQAVEIERPQDAKRRAPVTSDQRKTPCCMPR
jgi:hypothetical protein